MIRLPPRGVWSPGQTNPGLLATQLIFLLQAAFRGLDYLGGIRTGDPIQRAVEAAAPYPVWGWLFYGLSLLVLAGVAGRWASVMIIGHLAFAGLYLGMGGLVLSTTAGLNPSGTAGLLAAVAGTWMLLARRITGPGPRLGLALPLMVGGQLLITLSLGSDYRTGTGLALSGIVHAALATGVAWACARQQVRREEDEEVTSRGA